MKWIISLMLMLVLVVGGFAQGGGQTRVELRATLSGAGKGKASWKVRGATQAELQVEAERLPRNTPFLVQIGTATWSVMTDAFGKFNLAQRFIGTNRPDIHSGSVVNVVNGNGVTVLSGVFAG